MIFEQQAQKKLHNQPQDVATATKEIRRDSSCTPLHLITLEKDRQKVNDLRREVAKGWADLAPPNDISYQPIL